MPPRKRTKRDKAIEESHCTEDRFSSGERKLLLEAYNKHGFQVFQNFELLHQYFPERRECDLKGLIQRLQVNLSNGKSASNEPIDGWHKLCLQSMSNFAKDRKVNMNNIFADALMAEAEEINNLNNAKEGESSCSLTQPDYSKLLKSFAHLLMGRFPDNMSPVNAQLSMALFQHINKVVDSLDLKTISSTLEADTWLQSTLEERQRRQELALKGLDEIDGVTKKCPTLRDIEKNKNIEALCLELPKIKRIVDVLNPLHINESLACTLMKSYFSHEVI